MKMVCFKFHQNRAINEKFYFWGDQILSGGPEGGRGTQFQKFEKTSYRAVVSTHKENFSILALLESVQKSDELNRLLGSFSPPKGWAKGLISQIWKSLIQNGGPNPQPKFQHPSLTRKCLKIGGTEMWEERKKKHILDLILAIFRVP